MKNIKLLMIVMLCLSISFSTYSLAPPNSGLEPELSISLIKNLNPEQIVALRKTFETYIQQKGLKDNQTRISRQFFQALVKNPEIFTKKYCCFDLSAETIPIPDDSEGEIVLWHGIAIFVIVTVLQIVVTSMLSNPDMPTGIDDCIIGIGCGSLFPGDPLEQCYAGNNEQYQNIIENHADIFIDPNGCGENVCEDICEYFQTRGCQGIFPPSLIACLFSTGHPEWGCGEDYVDEAGNLICNSGQSPF